MSQLSSPLTQSPDANRSSAIVAIDLQEVSFAYPDSPAILQNVSLTLYEGERVGLIGHNGCGKTTLFMLICGLLPPHTGRISLWGQPVKLNQFRPEVGFLFQDPVDQLFCPSVWDDVAFGPQNQGLSELEVADRVNAALALTGTTALADRPPHHLSGGEKQMVAIAGLLAMMPRVLLYDEPTASLDLRTRRRLIKFLQQAEETLVIASHDLEFLLEVCDRVILLDEAHIIADGDPVTVMGDALLMEKHGLEKPHSLIPHSSIPHSSVPHNRLHPHGDRS